MDSGILLDVVIAVALVETIALFVLHARTGRGLGPGRLLPNLAAGLFLMLGARAAVAGAAWPWLAFCVVAAGVAHIVDMVQRWTVRGSARD